MYHAPITVNVTVGCATACISVFHANLAVIVVQILCAKWASVVRRAPVTRTVMSLTLYAKTASAFPGAPIAVNVKTGYAKSVSAVRFVPITITVVKVLSVKTAFAFLSAPIALNVKTGYAKSAFAALNAPIAMNVAMGLCATLASVFLSATPRMTVIQILNAKQVSAVLCVTLVSMVHVVKALNATFSNPWTFVSQRA